MNGYDLYSKMSLIDDELIQQNSCEKISKRKSLIPCLSAIAAALALTLTFIPIMLHRGNEPTPPLPPPYTDPNTDSDAEDDTCSTSQTPTDGDKNDDTCDIFPKPPIDTGVSYDPGIICPGLDYNVTEGDSETTKPSTDKHEESTNPPSPSITYTKAEMAVSDHISGIGEKYTGELDFNIHGSPAVDYVPMHFPIEQSCDIVSAKVINSLPSVYRSLRTNAEYRIFKMRVIDPIDSELNGEFYYALEAELYRDLSIYSEIIIGIRPLYSMYADTATGVTTSFFPIYSAFNASNEWSLLPFINGEFDASITEWGTSELPFTWDHENIIVTPTSTYIEAANEIRRLRKAVYQDRVDFDPSYEPAKFISENVSYTDPFVNGVFDRYSYGDRFEAVRYINGCITSEVISYWIENGSETGYYSKNRFTEEDMNGLINISDYIAQLDLSSLKPMNIDTSSSELQQRSCNAVGKYFKTENGVECLVRITWVYSFNNNNGYAVSICEDDMYIRLTNSGESFLSREEAKSYVGDSDFFCSFTPGEMVIPPAV